MLRCPMEIAKAGLSFETTYCIRSKEPNRRCQMERACAKISDLRASSKFTDQLSVRWCLNEQANSIFLADQTIQADN